MIKKILPRKLIKENDFYCPYCDAWFPLSRYLKTIFEGKTLFIANMITHYRHQHMDYYNHSVHYVGRFHDYDTFKAEVNNRIKRRLLRELQLTKDFSAAFLALQNNDAATLKLINETFGLKNAIPEDQQDLIKFFNVY